jgi:transposase-like protein
MEDKANEKTRKRGHWICPDCGFNSTMLTLSTFNREEEWRREMSGVA